MMAISSSDYGNKMDENGTPVTYQKHPKPIMKHEMELGAPDALTESRDLETVIGNFSILSKF